MQSSHGDLLLKGQVTALKLCQTSMLVQAAQILLQFAITWNEAYQHFPFYLLLNGATLLPHAYAFLLFTRYFCNDAPLNRACLPIASLIVLMTTMILIFQVAFIQLKDIGTGHTNSEQQHIGVSSDYSAKNSNGYSSGSKPAWRSRDSSSSQRQPKPVVRPTQMQIPNAASLLGFLAPLTALVIYWAVAYSAFNGYVQRHLPPNQRQ